MPSIERRYFKKFANSLSCHERGRSLFAGGVTHQTRFTSPFPVYFDSANGPFKYDVDGNEIIDYVMGAGSLIMGHSPPAVVAATAGQISRGTNLGGASTHEVRYAQAVQRLMPSMERIRFTNSGTEATLLALRIARAYTGKNRIIKFKEHFHGWHDYIVSESGGSIGGVPRSVLETVFAIPPSTDAVEDVLQQNGDIAALIVEPHGAHYGQFPLINPAFLREIRQLTEAHGVVFIMDEVITGFRLSTGGAHQRWNVGPDLITVAKIMGGGQPAGAVGGRAEIMDVMATRDDDSVWNKIGRVTQAGTFNGHPTAAVAGIATLEAIATKDIIPRADAMAQRLKQGLNHAFASTGVIGHAHGIASIIHVNLGGVCDCDGDLCTMPHEKIERTMTVEKTNALRRAMMVNGVDVQGGRAFMVSSAHEPEIIDRTIHSFLRSLKDLRAEGVV